MSRVFGRGELKQALLQVADAIGPANGYAIMHELGDRVGGSWRPSPGAIYPALLALEDEGLLAGVDEDGARRYELTTAGAAAARSGADVVEGAAARAADQTPPVTLGMVLDRLVGVAPHRDRRLDAGQVDRVERLVRPLFSELDSLTKETH